MSTGSRESADRKLSKVSAVLKFIHTENRLSVSFFSFSNTQHRHFLDIQTLILYLLCFVVIVCSLKDDTQYRSISDMM